MLQRLQHSWLATPMPSANLEARAQGMPDMVECSTVDHSSLHLIAPCSTCAFDTIHCMPYQCSAGHSTKPAEHTQIINTCNDEENTASTEHVLQE
jgi:hypothetical protein